MVGHAGDGCGRWNRHDEYRHHIAFRQGRTGIALHQRLAERRFAGAGLPGHQKMLCDAGLPVELDEPVDLIEG